ncbi:MAG: MarC family protein [Myxococcaceae bacterium]|jgi:multiple antibiotic resistance protein|nr:MarC family protein [Myxococcaceae bacterium]MCA3011934.1 MarC family protein [Myxococcaceae bacterium]
MWSTFLIAMPAVLFIVDPIGVVPLFVAMTASDPVEKCRAMAARACLTATGVLIFFALFGTLVFKIFGVTLAAFRVAGGFLLMLTALDMLRAQHPATKTSPEEAREGVEREDIAIVPLAMPLLAGPGAIATVMVLMAEYGSDWANAAIVVGCIGATFAITYLLLRSANLVKRVLRQTGIAVLERVFGLILAAIAVQFVFEGGKALLRG